MKKAMVALGVAVVLLLAAGAAVAADAGGVKATLSLKTWYNAWEEEDENDAGEMESRDFGSAWMLGPALTVRYSKFVFGASYLVSLQGYEPEGGDLTYERKDLDLTLTYLFVPQFGVFAGYKSIDSPIELTDGGDSYGSQTIKGPGLGITGNIPLGKAAALYGSLAYLKVDRDYDRDEGDDFSYDMSGFSIDLGFAYAFTPKISATIGIKGQKFEGESDSGDDHSSTFAGATAGVNYTF